MCFCCRGDPGHSEVPKTASLFNIKLEWGGALDGLNQVGVANSPRWGPAIG